MSIEQRIGAIETKLDTLISLLQPKELPKITLEEYLEMWLADFRGNIAPNTRYQDTNNVRNHIIPVLGSLYLSDIDIFTAQRFLNTFKAPRQREHIQVLLKHAFRKAIELGYLKQNVFAMVVKSNHQATETATLSKDALQLLLDKSGKYHSAFYVLANEGFRPGELLALTPSSIQSEGIHITNSYDSKRRLITTTKTKQSVRTVPYFANVEEILAQCSNNERLFPYLIRDLEDKFKDIVRAKDFSAYFVPRLTLYSLRHTCITNWAKSGVHPRVCMKWAGHSNIATTMRYYTHIDHKWELLEVEKTKNRGIEDNSIPEKA